MTRIRRRMRSPAALIGLDFALGIGGLPRGRVVEIFGPESSGKTTVALHCIAEAQKPAVSRFVDAEHALDVTYAQRLGVNIEELIVSQPDYGEQALEITNNGALRRRRHHRRRLRSRRRTAAEIDGEMGDLTVGLHARLMSQALRKLAGVLNKSKTLVIFINQLREKIGVMFGSPETTTGGRAEVLRPVRLTRRTRRSTEQSAVWGAYQNKVVKNKMAPPFKEAEVELIYGGYVKSRLSLLDTVSIWISSSAQVPGLTTVNSVWRKAERTQENTSVTTPICSKN